MKEGGQAPSLRQKVLSGRRWLSSEGTGQVERGRTWADGWGGRRTVSSCAPGGWKTRWWKTIEMGGKMDEGMDGEWSSWTESGLTFLSEECVPVRSLGQTERGGCRELKLLLIALLHPSGANWKQGRGYCRGEGCQQGGRESFLRWSINTMALHRDNPKAPFSLAHSVTSKTVGPFKVTESFTLSLTFYFILPIFLFLPTAAWSYHPSPSHFLEEKQIILLIYCFHFIRDICGNHYHNSTHKPVLESTFNQVLYKCKI